jgi:cellulose synthase/poly-beta-1,6-N-acetylglucosamine synthase-like glycosyltransferase
MIWLFWICSAIVAYTYTGYPLWLYLRSRLHARPIRASFISPRISIVMAVHNEAAGLREKLRQLQELVYDPEHLEIIVVSDGSTDQTNQILAGHSCDRVRMIILSEHGGKATALNAGIDASHGEILVFTDARQLIEPDAVQQLVSSLADPTIGCVSGELMLGSSSGANTHSGMGLYWTLEKKIRQWESATSSVVGATGAFYAVRKDLVGPIPRGTILDDVYIPLQIARQGLRVTFDSAARAWEPSTFGLRREYVRKLRTLTGNYQLLQLAPWILSRANPLRFEFISHKLLRLVVPFALMAILVSTIMLRGPFYETCLGLQLAFYAMGCLGLVIRKGAGLISRAANVPLTFLILNGAAAMALVNFLTGNEEVWVR